MNLRRAGLLALIVLSLANASSERIPSGSGTALVVVRTASAVLAAVDSKETWREYRDGHWSDEVRQICKAAAVGPYYAMVAGLDRGIGFDALEETAAAWHPGDRLDTLAANTASVLARSFGALLDSLRSADPAEFERRYAKNAALQLVLFGMEGRTTEVIILQLLGDRSLHVTRCPGDCPVPRSAFFLGTHDKIDESARHNSALVSRLDARNIASLIELEQQDRPDVVGGPVSVIRLTAAGAQLVQPGACSLSRELFPAKAF
jgi:hypothetical protein